MVNFSTSLDDIVEWPNLDTDPRVLDDPRMWAEAIVPGAVQLQQVASFTGPTLPATFTHSEMELVEARRAVLKRAVPLYEGGFAQLRVGLREMQGGVQNWGPRYAPLADGVFRLRDIARYHQVSLELSGDWRRAQGLDLQGAILGAR